LVVAKVLLEDQLRLDGQLRELLSGRFESSAPLGLNVERDTDRILERARERVLPFGVETLETERIRIGQIRIAFDALSARIDVKRSLQVIGEAALDLVVIVDRTIRARGLARARGQPDICLVAPLGEGL